MLLDYDLPHGLVADLRRIRLQNSKEDFVKNLNESLNGQLDRLTDVFIEIWSETPQQFLYKTYTTPPNETRKRTLNNPLTDILWTRFESLPIANFQKFPASRAPLGVSTWPGTGLLGGHWERPKLAYTLPETICWTAISLVPHWRPTSWSKRNSPTCRPRLPLDGSPASRLADCWKRARPAPI